MPKSGGIPEGPGRQLGFEAPAAAPQRSRERDGAAVGTGGPATAG